MADLIEVSVNHYGKYERGEIDIPFSKAIKLAEYYNVSLDYIAGRTNDKKFCRDLSPARLVKLFGNLNHDNQIRIEERLWKCLNRRINIAIYKMLKILFFSLDKIKKL